MYASTCQDYSPLPFLDRTVCTKSTAARPGQAGNDALRRRTQEVRAQGHESFNVAQDPEALEGLFEWQMAPCEGRGALMANQGVDQMVDAFDRTCYTIKPWAISSGG